jgi:CheY-like chemotaxis protein
MVMPMGMSGRDLANQLKQFRPGLKVIYTSGYALELTKDEQGLPREFALLPKPFRPRMLSTLVRNFLDDKIST